MTIQRPGLEVGKKKYRYDPFPSLPSPFPLSLHLFPFCPFLSLPFTSPLLCLALPLKVGPLNPARGLGERYKLPRRGSRAEARPQAHFGIGLSCA